MSSVHSTLTTASNLSSVVSCTHVHELAAIPVEVVLFTGMPTFTCSLAALLVPGSCMVPGGCMVVKYLNLYDASCIQLVLSCFLAVVSS